MTAPLAAMTAPLAALAAPLAAVVSLLGLAIGSFLNVVAHRVPRGESVVAPRSACPACGHAIRAYDNVPVLSWLVLRGRCRDCGARIAARYSLVELATGALFAVVALAFGPAVLGAGSPAEAAAAIVVLAAHLALAGFGVALTAIDLDTQRLPNALVLPLLGTGVVAFAVAGPLSGDLGATVRALAGGAILFAVYLVLHLVRPDGMGAGDVKLAAALGVFLGWSGWGALAVGAIAAFALGAVVGIVLMLVRRIGRKGGIPFGPWMIGGAWIGILAGEPLARAYLSLFGLAA
ncbi:prepilin peptidase [Microbacterium album]|uniref:Prepilin leader peptidase/N-methyltransferase n=1 Tax=Microbacterium album TaxID=2053191 RepID=A0A917IGQ5_9MICO|nr:A24 family peptidase [Microbacterium album]GGH50434.1 prepilin peptidase [Microbacterium album]